jgi:HSP20 family protein
MLLRRRTGWPTTNWARSFEELERLQRQMDLLTGGPAKGFWGEPRAGVFPLVNLTEDKENYYVRSELPGFMANDLDISATGDSLTISGERKIPAEEENATYHRKEREAGTFSRIIALPGQIDTDKVEARSRDGILTVVLQKAAATKPKQITIKTA